MSGNARAYVFNYANLSICLESDLSVSVTTLDRYGMNHRKNIPGNVARQIAEWILEMVPGRDREADMRKLAEGVLNYCADHPGVGYLGAIWRMTDVDASEDYRVVILRYLGIEPGYKGEMKPYRSEQLEYAESLMDDLPRWIRDRALGIGGD